MCGPRSRAPESRPQAWAAPGRGHVLGGRWHALTSLQFSDLEKWTRSSLYISWVLMTSLYSFWLRSSGLMPLALRNSW